MKKTVKSIVPPAPKTIVKMIPCKTNHAFPWAMLGALIFLEAVAGYTIKKNCSFVATLPGDKVVTAEDAKEQADEMDNCRQMLKMAQKRAANTRIKGAIKDAIEKIDNGQRSEAEDELRAAVGGEQ